jgi:immune inhibitor A
MNVWDKSALGFVQPRSVKRGKDVTVKLQAAATGDADATGVKIQLPKATHTIPLSGKDGAVEWYSTMGNDLDVSLTTKNAVTVPSGADLTYRTWYEIENGYDHGFVEVSDDGGATWDTLVDYSDVDTEDWAVTQTVDLSAYEGKSVLVRFEYFTDGGVAPRGWEVADIRLGATTLGESAWTTDGWLRLDGEWTQKTDRYYIAEYRNGDGSDASLRNCYQWNYNYANWVDWYGYNKGLHLIYRDTFYADNDVALHEGRGGWMVVDSHPMPDGVAYSDGADDYFGYWRPRIQVRDASFSLKPTRTQSVYFVDYDQGWGVGEDVVPGKGGRSTFNDSKSYWYAEAPEAGVKIPRNLGVRIIVKSMNDDTMTIRVDNVK